MSIIRTKRCIICGSRKIVDYRGHVHTKSNDRLVLNQDCIITSFCRKHLKAWEGVFATGVIKDNCSGCYGDWQNWMGRTDTKTRKT